MKMDEESNVKVEDADGDMMALFMPEGALEEEKLEARRVRGIVNAAIRSLREELPNACVHVGIGIGEGKGAIHYADADGTVFAQDEFDFFDALRSTGLVRTFDEAVAADLTDEDSSYNELAVFGQRLVVEARKHISDCHVTFVATKVNENGLVDVWSWRNTEEPMEVHAAVFGVIVRAFFALRHEGIPAAEVERSIRENVDNALKGFPCSSAQAVDAGGHHVN